MSDALTVAELIAELEKLPSDLRVLAEGCDCYGEARSVKLINTWSDDEDATVLISRSAPAPKPEPVPAAALRVADGNPGALQVVSALRRAGRHDLVDRLDNEDIRGETLYLRVRDASLRFALREARVPLIADVPGIVEDLLDCRPDCVFPSCVDGERPPHCGNCGRSS